MWIQLGCAFLIFISLIIFSLIPYCGLSVGARSKNGTLLLSLCNCVACGIFLSTCFLGLIPHVIMQERAIRQSWGAAAATAAAAGMHMDHDEQPAADAAVKNASGGLSPTTDFLLNTQLLVLAGFVVILMIEQAIFACSGHSHSHSESGGGHSHLHNQDDEELRMGRLGGGVDSASAPLVDGLFDDEDDDDMDAIIFRKEGGTDHASLQHQGHGGHSHAVSLSSGLSLRTLFLLLGLSVHSLFEGLALGLQGEGADFYSMMFAIMLHEILCCLAYGVSLAQQRAPMGAAVVSVLVLSACIPAGMLVALVVSMVEGSSAALIRFVLEALAAGTFVYVACVEMLANELQQLQGRNGVAASFAVAAGVLLFAALQSASHHH